MSEVATRIPASTSPKIVIKPNPQSSVPTQTDTGASQETIPDNIEFSILDNGEFRFKGDPNKLSPDTLDNLLNESSSRKIRASHVEEKRVASTSFTDLCIMGLMFSTLGVVLSLGLISISQKKSENISKQSLLQEQGYVRGNSGGCINFESITTTGNRKRSQSSRRNGKNSD